MTPRSPRALTVLVLACASFALGGCDKLKTMAGKGDADGGTSASSGGGLLSSVLGGDFEGEISMQATSPGKPPTDMVFDIKKPRLRIDAQKGIPGAAGGGGIGVGAGKGAVLLVDPPQKKGWALSPAEKRAVLFDFEKLKNAPSVPGVPDMRGAGKPKTPPKMEKGGTDKVAGYTCDVWKITHESGKRSEVCAAEGITWIDVTDLGWSSPEVMAAAALSDVNRFPLRVVVFGATGAVESKLEATKVEKKKLDDAQFVVPPDYQVVDMAAMMGAFRGLGGAGGLPPGVKPKVP